ncbi:MAG TPA: inositol monophosphatase [Rhodobacteraceae bacterium]|nr:inositol monophosphatase [Paracoccaceae bacterium]
MHAYLKNALSITDAAQAIPLKHFRQGIDIIHKTDMSPVTMADHATERFIRDALHAAFPDHGIIGEEFDPKHTDNALQWIIDPIDGTRAFISGLPLFGMLLGLLENGAPRIGVVRMPGLGEVWCGDGVLADMNGQAIEVAETAELAGAMLYINEADKIMRDAPEVFARLNAAGRDRRYSYDCYPHMLLAAGHVDACVDYDLKPYDFLPMVPIVEGAGGVITDWQGGGLDLNSDGRVVSAATPELHEEVLELLR